MKLIQTHINKSVWLNNNSVIITSINKVASVLRIPALSIISLSYRYLCTINIFAVIAINLQLPKIKYHIYGNK